MSCVSDITQSIGRECKSSLGGNSVLYLFNYIEDPFTYANSIVTAINAGLTTVYEYELEGDGNTLEESMVSDRNTGTSVNTQTLTAMMKKMTATKTAEFNLLVKGFPIGVVKDRNGEFHAIGIDDGIDFTVLGATGGAKTDMNGYTLTGVSTTGELSPKLDSATQTAFLALVA